MGTAYVRGMKQLTPGLAPGLTPGLTHGILQKWLTPPYETQGFAYATQSYDTTLLKVYSGVDDLVKR